MTYGELIWTEVHMRLRDLTWSCENCTQTLVCEEQGNGESRYCEHMIYTAIMTDETDGFMVPEGWAKTVPEIEK